MVSTPITYNQHPAHVRPLRGRQVRLDRTTRNPRLRRCAPYLGLLVYNLFEVVPMNQPEKREGPFYCCKDKEKNNIFLQITHKKMSLVIKKFDLYG